NTSVNWPVGLGGKGNEGVTGLIKQTPNSIGYVELIYAAQNNIPYGAVKNSSGNFVKADMAGVSAAAAGAAKDIPEDFRVSITNATGKTTLPNAGPVTGSRSFLSRLRDGDEIARLTTMVFAASVVLITLLLVYELWTGSALARAKFGLHFLVTRVWDPNIDQYGALPFMYGTLVTSAVALLIAVPL